MNRYCVLTLICMLLHISATAQKMAGLSGKIISETDNSKIDFADLYLKGTDYWCVADSNGRFHLEAPAGTYTFVVSAIGFETFTEEVTLKAGESRKKTIALKTAKNQLDEAVIIAKRESHVERSAFNAVDLSVKEMHNSSKNLGEALAQLPGLKLRESGGVGSDAQLSLDGFSGKHVKIFIDGVPQEGTGAALDINNLPVNFAERIEVYKGVVPVGFGTDALGGVINIVTNKRRRGWNLDASYTYGSFNTHKSYVNFNQTFRNGLTYEINAFQNFSDNSYWIDSYITEFSEDGVSENTDRNKIYHVRRFNDQFHNEAVIGKIGVTGKSWADRLLVGFNYSHFYKEIQTGVYQYIVFGEKHRRGHSFVPSGPSDQRAGCHVQRQLQPQHHDEHRHFLLQIQLIGRPQIHRKPRRAVLPGQQIAEHQLECNRHRRLPSGKSPLFHPEPRIELLQAHHPVEGGRQLPALGFQHPETDPQEHHRTVIPAVAIEKMERDSLRQILQPVQPGSCLAEQRRGRQLRQHEPHHQCVRIWGGRHIFHHQGTAGKTLR